MAVYHRPCVTTHFYFEARWHLHSPLPSGLHFHITLTNAKRQDNPKHEKQKSDAINNKQMGEEKA